MDRSCVSQQLAVVTAAWSPRSPHHELALRDALSSVVFHKPADAAAAAAAGGGGGGGAEGPKNDECSICLTEFEQDERVKALPCGHLFHSRCIKHWLGVDVRCPNCRMPAVDGAVAGQVGPA